MDQQKELMREILFSSTNMAAMTYVKTTYGIKFTIELKQLLME